MELYKYKAKVIKAYDGDTITCEVDLGFETKMTIRVRFAGIDTPELRGEEREAGLVVRDIVREILLDKIIFIKTEKDKTGKYGRYIADILVPNEYLGSKLITESIDVDGLVNLNQWLLDNDYAKVYGS